MSIGGPSSFSVTETLPWAMMQLPQVTLFGTNTQVNPFWISKHLAKWMDVWSLCLVLASQQDGIDFDKVGNPRIIITYTEPLPQPELFDGSDSWLKFSVAHGACGDDGTYDATDPSGATIIHMIEVNTFSSIAILTSCHF